MSFSIRDLFEYDLNKRDCEFKSVCLKNSFSKVRTTKGGC